MTELENEVWYDPFVIAVLSFNRGQVFRKIPL
jgi:hypothetical protein